MSTFTDFTLYIKYHAICVGHCKRFMKYIKGIIMNKIY